MSDEIEAYQTALGTLINAEKVADKLAEIISDGADKMTNWKIVSVVETTPEFRWPPEVGGMRPRVEISGKNWPTVFDIGEALTAYHRAKFAVGAAWKKVPAERRVGLQPPPG